MARPELRPHRAVAYIDESQRGQRYLMAAAAIDSRTAADVRKAMGQLRPGGGQARRHFHKESAVMRRKMLDRTGVTYSHEVAHTTEPMLWIPDAIVWCAGAKPEWRVQLDGWVTVQRT